MKTKRIFSLFLVLVTILGLWPTTAFAKVDKTDLDEALGASGTKTLYVKRSDEEVALRIYKANGSYITGRTSTFGTTGNPAPGGDVGGVMGVAYCTEFGKEYAFTSENGKRIPYPYTITVDASNKNNVNCTWPDWMRGIIATGYPTKDLTWLRKNDHSYVTQTEPTDGSKFTAITAAE